MWTNTNDLADPSQMRLDPLRMRDDSRLAQLLGGIFGELNADPKYPSMELLPLYDIAARNLHDLGRFEQAVELLEQVFKIKDITLTEDHPDRLASQHELASAYLSNGLIKQAVVLMEKVVEIENTTLAEDHPNRLASQHELARAYQSNGQVKLAVKLLEQVVEIEKITLAEDHPDRLISQYKLDQLIQASV